MSEPKFKVGDRVRYVEGTWWFLQGMKGIIRSIPGSGVNSADVTFDDGTTMVNIPFTALEKTKPRHKKITIKVKHEGDGYRVLEVDALRRDELPTEYLTGRPCVVMHWDELAITTIYGKDSYYLRKGRYLTKKDEQILRETCAEAGKRLHEINKRKREEAKIETWEW